MHAHCTAQCTMLDFAPAFLPTLTRMTRMATPRLCPPSLTLCPPATPLQGYEVAAPVIKQGVDVMLPVVTKAARQAGELAAPALESAAPALSVSDMQMQREARGGGGQQRH